MRMPGTDTGTWFFPYGLNRETYETARRPQQRPRSFRRRRDRREHQARQDDHRRLDTLDVAATSRTLGT
ncbi:hypothetical protein [Streptomyces sp. NPDC051001]|uniref:hypothetical protein n=1 Tax=Streptomyces sp. NPDC051001 TaxID=3155795 RepID=UPI00342504A2